MSRRLALVIGISLACLGSAFALFQYLAPQSAGIIASVFRGGDIVDTWHTSTPAGAQTVDMGFTENTSQVSYGDQIVDGYRYLPAFQLQNCTLSKENGLLCNGSAYGYDAKVLTELTEVVAKQTFNIQFIAARYTEDKPLPISSRDKTQTIQSDKVFFVTDQKYIGGLRIEPNTVIVVADRKPAIPFFRNTVESSYRDSQIKRMDVTNDFSPIGQIVQQNYVDQKTNLSVSDLNIIQGGSSVNFGEDIQSLTQIGTDSVQFALQGFSSLSPSALTNLKASLAGDSLSPTRSGSTLLLTTNKSIKQDTRLPLIVSYTYGGVSQTLRFQYRTLPVFSASYKQEQDYSTSKLSNRTTLTFSQAVSGTALDAALKSTKIPYQFDYRDKNTSSTVYGVTRYTDPTKTTSIDLSALRSLYGDTLTKSFILKIEPYSLAEYQRYASVVGSPIALVPQSSEYAYKAIGEPTTDA